MDAAYPGALAQNSLTDLVSLINQQIAAQEHLFERLSKAEAIAHVALSEDFLDYKPSIIHAYLWALEDLITDAKKLNQQATDNLFKESRGLRYQ